MAAYLQRYGEVSAELRLEDRLVSLVEDGIDLAVRIGNLADSSLVARHVGEMRRIVVASPTYLKRHGEPKRPAEIAGHQTIQFCANSATGEWRFHRGRPRIPPRHRAALFPAMLRMLRSSMPSRAAG